MSQIFEMMEHENLQANIQKFFTNTLPKGDFFFSILTSQLESKQDDKEDSAPVQQNEYEVGSYVLPK